MKPTLVGLALLVLAACSGAERDRIAELEAKVSHLQETATAERESYERQLNEAKSHAEELLREIDELRPAAETAQTLAETTGAFEGSAQQAELELAQCRAQLGAYQEGLETAVGELNRQGSVHAQQASRGNAPVDATAHLRISGVGGRTTDQDGSHWTYAWQATVWNQGSSPANFDLKIQLVDAQGLEISTDHQYGLSLRPNAQQSYTGSRLLSASMAQQIASVRARTEAN